MAEDMFQAVTNALRQTQASDSDTRKKAEMFLKEMEKQAGFPQILIRIIEIHSQTNSVDDKSLRTIGAILFKNQVKNRWSPSDESNYKDNPLSQTDKEMIKGNMVNIMCLVPTEVQKQLSEALVIISKHDFPHDWESLLPDLTSRMANSDINVIFSILMTLNSIIKRFRFEFKSDDLFRELSYVLKGVQEPLTHLLQKMGVAVKSLASDSTQLATVFECLRLIARIFFSLNWQDIPEYFEDNMSLWMGQFLIYLSYDGPLPADPSIDDEPNALEKLQAAIVENINLYASKYEEEFQPLLAGFTSAIWSLLLKVSQQLKHDILASTCIRFLTSIVSKQLHSSLFSEEATIRQIIENIVVPNVRLREIEEELFIDNPQDYIQRDMEGSDSDTRRRVSCDLIRGMCKHHEMATTKICSEYIQTLLSQYSQNPNLNWKAKDAAIQLLLAVSVRSSTLTHGVSETNKYMDIMEIFSTSILPEINDGNVNNRPILRADCIKFITIFRNQFSSDQMKALIPILISHLTSEHAVVATYAALAIEKIQIVKDRPVNNLGQHMQLRGIQRFGRNELGPFSQDLFTNLFAVLDNADMPDNEYVMKAIMRCLNTVQDEILPIAQIVLSKAVRYLAKVCANPGNPHFNHYLFESVAILVSRVCQSDANSIDLFESNLFPPFQQVLVQDVVEFTPYVFQILAQLLELRPAIMGTGSAFTPAYLALYPPLLSPALWERKGNVPALVRLLQAYLQKDAKTIVGDNRLPALLGIFQKLLISRSTEEHAFSFLSTIFLTVEPQQLDSYVKDVFNLTLLRLQNNRHPKYIRFLTHFFSVLICKYDATFLMRCFERVQSGLFAMILSQIWLPLYDENIILTEREKKVFAVGLTKLACDLNIKVCVEPDATLFVRTVKAVLTILAPDDSPQKSTSAADFDESEKEISFDSTYCKLVHANTGVAIDPAKDIPDARAFFSRSLSKFCSLSPGRYAPMFTQSFTPHQLGALQTFCTECGVILM